MYVKLIYINQKKEDNMKTISLVIATILLLGYAFLIYLMQKNIPTSGEISQINTIAYSILLGLLAFSSGFMLNQSKLEEIKSDSTKQIRKAEKAGIDTKESMDKIDRLNAKIETLEIALQEAIKNKK